MKRLLAVLMTALPALSFAEPAALTLDRPSVVVLSTPDAEVSSAEAGTEAFAEFLDDFETYSRAVALALRKSTRVQFIDSNASTVRFLHSAHAPVTRRALSGYGFIVFVPGKAPVVFEGVATDQEVLCELKRLLPQADVQLDCGPGESHGSGRVAHRLP